MAIALELHREVDMRFRITPIEREMRRRLFWTCYLMDRFTACGSKRPSLVGDKSILLRLPSWSPNEAGVPIEGEFFQNGSNLQYHSATGKKSQGSTGMLIDIVRILGITNRYLAAGGVKGDSHFPWHSLSNLSKIRHELDIWASGTQDVFTSIDVLFGQADSTTLVLSKLVYHLIHCLIYRPFLPIDLLELAGTGQHQSWQIEATNLCFLHANAIAELVELGKQSGSIEWPAFVGYCICTAGTVHVHGAHYKGRQDGEVFSASGDFLSREMQQLSELRYVWASVQHQRDTLQTIYDCHSELVESLAGNAMRYSPMFHLEDFFDRYSTLGQPFDGAHISFSDIPVDVAQDTYMGHALYAPQNTNGISTGVDSSSSKGKSTSPTARRKTNEQQNQMSTNMQTSMITPSMMDDPLQPPQPTQPNDTMTSLLTSSTAPDPQQTPIQTFTTLSTVPFSPPYSFSSGNPQDATYDPMFAMPTPNFSSAQLAPGWAGGFSYDYGSGDAGGGGGGNQAATPGGRSMAGESTGSRGEEKDPFLSLLEQLAESEGRNGGLGGGELDSFFLGGGGQ
jgi:hypothetical protein